MVRIQISASRRSERLETRVTAAAAAVRFGRNRETAKGAAGSKACRNTHGHSSNAQSATSRSRQDPFYQLVGFRLWTEPQERAEFAALSLSCSQACLSKDEFVALLDRKLRVKQKEKTTSAFHLHTRRATYTGTRRRFDHESATVTLDHNLSPLLGWACLPARLLRAKQSSTTDNGRPQQTHTKKG